MNVVKEIQLHLNKVIYDVEKYTLWYLLFGWKLKSFSYSICTVASERINF